MNADPPTGPLFRAAAEMQAEAVARSVIPALRGLGLDPVVLKGPALTAWLYGDGTQRTYADLDLLVDPATFETAGACLEGLGYERGQAGWDELSFAWRRPDQRFAIDLHRSLVGADSEPGTVWRELRAHAREGELLGVGCLSLDEIGLALHVATHAAQHAFEGEQKPVEDLRRALATADRETWEAAAALAARIGASPAFAAGLRTLPEGEGLAEDLELGREMPVDVAVRASADAAPLVLGIEQMRRIEGAGPRLKFALSKVFPSRAQMRATSGLARRGRRGLTAAYVARPFVAAVELPRALARHRSLAGAAGYTGCEGPDDLDDGELSQRDQRQSEPPGGTG